MSEKMPRIGAIERSSDEQETSYDNNRTTPALRSLVSEIMDWRADPSTTGYELECLLSRHMKKDGDFAFSEQMLFSSKKWISDKQINVTGPRNLRLQFMSNICPPVFTGVPIKGEDNQPLTVALIDGQSGEVVTFGPEASARVEIVVLEADFGGNLGDSWTPEDFKSRIVTKEGNKRLLTRDVVLDLKEGIGCVGIVRFSQNKTWAKKRAYRLGVMAMDDYIRTKIREGFTDSFDVKDRRLTLNKKHYPPTLSDEVWRLDGIARDGSFHQRLSDKEVGIVTVEDLLKKLNTDPQKLRDILGKNMSAKMWEALVDHARTCLIPPENDELDLPQPAVSFDDKPSLFDESPGLSNIVYPPKSPTMESSCGNKIISYPKIDALDFPQPAVSFHDKESLFDESASLNNIIFPPKCPIEENSSGTLILVSRNNDDLDFPPPAFSFDDDAILFDESPGPSNVICPPKSPIKESCSGPQPVIPSQEIIPTFDSVWDMSYYNDYNWQCVDHTCHKHERRLSYSSQVTDSDNWEMESMIQPWWEENHDIPLQFSVDDVPLDTQGLISESLDNPQNNGNEPLETRPTVALMNNTWKRYLRNKAKRKWRVLFSVMRWLFVCRNAAGKLSGGGFPVKLSSSYQDSQALDSVDSWHKQPLTSGGDCVVPTSYETKSFQIFGSHAPGLSRNLSMKSEANLHSAVNDILFARSVAVAANIAQRKYMSKREKALRRWTKLYSVMRWFSVQRNATKRASSALIVGDPSCSNSLDGLSAIFRHDGYVRNWDMCPNEQNSMSFTCSFHDDEFVQLFNAFCSLQPRNRVAMNKLARRRNAADGNFAKTRWRMLFSVMKWLSVSRSTARVKGPCNKY